MEGAFNHVGNHLVSDSAAAINAGDNDDLSTIDPDENLLYSKYGGRGDLSGARRRRHDDDDNGTEVFDDGDVESIVGTTADDMQGLKLEPEEEEEEGLPAHACAYVLCYFPVALFDF